MLAALLASSAPAAASAQPHVDALLYDLEGRVALGATDFGPPFAQIADVRVFPVALDLDDATSSPGFTGSESPPDGEPLPGNTPVAFDLLPVAQLAGRNLSYWDLAGPVAFADPAGVRLIIAETGCFTCEEVVADGASAERAGFVLGETGPTGVLHEHHEFMLAPPQGSGNLAPNGVYLLSLRGRVEGLLPSDPFFFVFGNGTTPAQLEEAALWVEANLLVPEPGATVLDVAALGALGVLRRRREPRAR